MKKILALLFVLFVYLFIQQALANTQIDGYGVTDSVETWVAITATVAPFVVFLIVLGVSYFHYIGKRWKRVSEQKS